jgi:hypothetical protein
MTIFGSGHQVVTSTTRPATAAEIVMAAELPAPPSTELPVLPEA